MTDDVTTPAPERANYGGASFALAIVFGLLYAYVLWAAIGNLVQLPALTAERTPWWLLILDVVLPVAAYAGAFLFGLRSSLPMRALLFLLGLCLLACSTIGSIAFVPTV
jgi:hypothetical protein